MSALRPLAFSALLRRLELELAGGGPVFGLARKDWHVPRPEVDLSHGLGQRRAANPIGPAAGPHTQLAQNMVQGWLAGARVFELKTIQVRDQLSIPRPCIHAPHYALNVEWSQELSLAESVREYQKTAWLLEILRRSRAGGGLPPRANLDFLLDLSVGYSLEGLRSTAMRGALQALRQPEAGFESLRDTLDAQQRRWAGDPPAGPVAECVTLSTFHGCPPEEIGAMAGCLLEDGWHVIIKLNPTLLGLERVRHILHERLGYHHLQPDAEAFARDLSLHGAVDLLGELHGKALGLGRSLGVKFTNTLVLHRDAALFPEDAGPHMYLSGAPLHPLALATAAEVVERLPQALPLSFSAGVDRHNAAGLLRCGLAPLTLCTDLLRRGGQARMAGLLRAIEDRVASSACATLAEFQGNTAGSAAEAWKERAHRLRQAADIAASDESHAAVQVMRPPRKLTRVLKRLDCINCDICQPVCPNGALFTWVSPTAEARGVRQIGVLADACNACSNCETWCPELGAPWRVKERWHQSAESLLASPEDLDGSCFHQDGLLLRFGRQLFRYRPADMLQEDVFEVVVPDGAALASRPVADAHRAQHLERARMLWKALGSGGDHPVSTLWGGR